MRKLNSAKAELKKTVACKKACMLVEDLMGMLTLPVPCIFESCIEIKIELNFSFHTYLWCLKKVL